MPRKSFLNRFTCATLNAYSQRKIGLFVLSIYKSNMYHPYSSYNDENGRVVVVHLPIPSEFALFDSCPAEFLVLMCTRCSID